MAVTKTDIVNRFNAIVRNGLTPAAGTAVWYSGNSPQDPGNINLGARAEPGKIASEVPGAALMASAVFNVLHGFAMEYTRVRMGRIFYLTDAAPLQYGPSLTALHPRLALYFPIPGGQREPGIQINATQLDAFLVNLRNQVNAIRSGAAYTFTIIACHNSCHSACHGSRGRR